jgi:hypothetical protein
VVNFEQILFANGRMLNLTEAPAQGGRAIQFDFLTGTHPGVRCPRSETCRAKGNTMQVPSMLQGESLKRLLQGAVAGAIATMFVGFYWGGWSLGEDRQMWFYVQMWLPMWTVALTAAICFSVASFIMGQPKPQR